MNASDYKLINNAEELRTAVEELKQHAAIGFDTETTDLDPYRGRLRLIQLAAPDGVRIIDLERFADTDLKKSDALAPLRDLLAAPRPIKIAHNCLTRDMKVSMADGTKVLLGELVRNKTRAKVLCLNEETGGLAVGEIVDWIEASISPWENWLRIRTRGKGRLRVTKDHEILTERGRIRASDLLVGDKVLTHLPELSQQQKEMLYGSLLGDGSLTMQTSALARTPHFKVSHSEEQQDYVALKAIALADLVKSVKAEKTNFRGVSNSESGTRLISLITKSDARLFELYDNCLVAGKRVLMSGWLENLTMPAIAIWYCDDGTLSGGSSASICVSALGNNGANMLVEFLCDKGFPAKLWTRTDEHIYLKIIGPMGRGMSEGLKLFWESIAPYVPVSMQYKLPAAYRHLASDEYWATSNTPAKVFSDTVVEILPLLNDSSFRGRYEGYRRGESRGMKQYCLTVSPHRNFIAGGLAVSNCKFDAKWVKHTLGVELGGVFDTLLASQLVSAGDMDERHGLEAVAARHLDVTIDKAERLSDWSGELSESQLRYAALDASVLPPLREELIKRLKADALLRCAQLEFECVLPVASIELAGIYLDKERWREQLAVVGKRRATLAEELQNMLAEESSQGSLFGGPTRMDINLDSHVQLTRALKRIGIQDLPDSTRNWKLQPLAEKYKEIKTLLEYRTVQKALTSYGENILNEINPVTGRIHANFHQIGAPTGRFACNSPNIQQVPHSIEYRRCFRAPEGRKFIISDYCVAQGTRVATRRGLVRVEQVEIGDEVFLEDGRAAEVYAVIVRGTLPVSRVTLKNGYALTATSLHRIRVLSAEGDYVWRRIQDLKTGDCVVIQPGRGLHENLPDVRLPDPVSSHFNNNKNLTAPLFANELLATFMGYIAGDGTFGKSYLGWVVNLADADVAEQLKALAAEMFGIEVHERRPYKGVADFGLYSVPLVRWCSEIGVSKNSLPEFLWRSRPAVAAAYLRGLFEADGSVTDSETGKVSFSSSREQLAADVHRMLLALGIPATLRQQRDTGPDKRFTCWHVSIVASGLAGFHEHVGFISARKRSKLTALVSRWTGKTVVGNMPNLRYKVRALQLSGEARRLLNNTSSLGRPVTASLASVVEDYYPEVAGALGLQHLTEYKQLFLPVVSIVAVGEQPVFDLSVPGPKTYISDGFISHNSQIELRILADFTNDQGFIDAFNSGADLHRVTAAQVFNTPLEGVTKEQRDFAKRLNFGVVYGIGAQRFSMMTGLSLTDAEDILRRYFATYRQLDAWLRDAALKAVRERTARTASGRLARFRFDSEDRQAISLAQRNGKNTPVQGCLCYDSKIFTESDGYIEIGKLEGKAVKVWDGGGFVNASVAYSGKRQKVKVEFWGGYYIECSPEHRFLTIDVNGRTSWRTPAEFVKGNYVKLSDSVGEWSVPFQLPIHETRAHNAIQRSISAIGNMYDMGVWLGRTASDGNVGNYAVRLLVAEHEEEILPFLKKLCEDIGYTRHNIRITPARPRRLHNLQISSVSLAKQLLTLGLKTRIPDCAWRNSRALAGYLRGMFDGDGTVNPDGAVLTFGKGPDFHLEWAREIQQALLLFGIRSRVNRCADRINVCILKRDMPLFCERVGFINPLKQAKAEAISDGTGYENKIYGRAARIKRVEFTDEWVEMYDVVDSETSQFMVNGLITHNSSADILKRALRLLHDELRDTSACIVNIVHDEIVVEVDADETDVIAKKVEDAMCKAGAEYVKKVPVKVETEVANEWVK